jgi:hypothetical protein
MWWKQEKTKIDGDPALATTVFDTVKGLEEAQRARLNDLLIYASIYGNAEVSGFGPHQYALSSLRSRFDKMSINMVHNLVDTVTAKLVAHPVKPTFLTDKGDYILQRRAQKLDSAVQGVLYENDFMHQAGLVVKDGALFGTGVLKVVQEDGRVCLERVLPAEILVDNAEALYANPQSMYQIRYMDRNKLIELFPEFRDGIMAAKTEDDGWAGMGPATADVIKVVEAWKKGGSGRHVIAINSTILVDEKWSKESFPFAFFQWNPRVAGFYGEGLAEQLIPIQMEINKLARRIQVAQHLMSVPYFLVERGSKVNKSHFTNTEGFFVDYTGRPPQQVVGQAMNPEVYLHLERLIRLCHETAGVSALSSQSKKPSGLDSEPALRTFHDIESERFQFTGKMYERFVLQVARLIVDVARDIKGYKVRGINKKFFEEFSWKDIDLDDSEFVLKMHATSMLPTTPSARLQKVLEMFERGMLNPVEAMKLIDFPDVEAATAKKTAQLDVVQDVLATMEETGKFMPPEPFMNLQMCLEEATNYYMQLKLRKAPEGTLALFRKFIRACDDKLSSIAQAAQGVTTNVPPEATLGAPVGIGAQPPIPGPVPPGPFPPGGAPAGIPA